MTDMGTGHELAGMDMSSMKGMDHGSMQGMGQDAGNTKGAQQSGSSAANSDSMPGIDHDMSNMSGMDHGAMDHGAMAWWRLPSPLTPMLTFRSRVRRITA
jgi:hypothetical protein